MATPFKKFLVLLLICYLNFELTAASNILFFNGFSSHSHLVALEPLANKLADQGHKVTILSPMTSEKKHEKIVYFCPEALRVAQEGMNIMGEHVVTARMKSKYNDFFLQTSEAWDGAVEMCRVIYTSPEFITWIESSTFDLVIMDVFQRECALPIAYKFGAKSIFFVPATMFYGDHETFGFPTDAAWSIPFSTQHWLLPDSIVFEWESLSWYFWRQWTHLPKFDKLVQSDLIQRQTQNKGEIPSLAELEQRTSLYFLNQYFTAEFPRSLPPFVVPVGGMHCKDSKGIQDKAIKEFIEDKNTEGVIYISFGTFLKVSGLPLAKQQIFFETMAAFPNFKFLWKWEDEIPKNLPKNILMMKWFPQQDILAHSKCRGFISQGGMMSYQQAIYHSVPMIILPGGGDQVFNARLISQSKFGIHLEFSELNHQNFKAAIKDLLYNKKYEEKASELSRLFKDRPMAAVDTAVYWTEYVLRYDEGHLNHLKSPAMRMSWWERRVLHLWGSIVGLIIFAYVCISKGLASYFRVHAKVKLTTKKIN